MSEKIKRKKAKKDNKVIFKADLRRGKSGDLKLEIETTKEIEEFMKRINGEVNRSRNWSNNGDYLEYYRKGDYENDVREFFKDKYNNFGHQFLKYDKVNLGILRTKGISKGITLCLDSQYSEESLIEAMKKLRRTTKEIYQRFIRELRIKTTLKVTQI